MAKHIPKAFRRATALLTSLLLIAAQMVLPLAALAQDISMLPTVTIQWSAADGSVQSMPVTATLYGDQVVYWASVSEEAMQAGVMYGFAGLADNILAKLKMEVGPAFVVATGGLSDVIAGDTHHINTVDKLLTLKGLQIIYNKNR